MHLAALKDLDKTFLNWPDWAAINVVGISGWSSHFNKVKFIIIDKDPYANIETGYYMIYKLTKM